MYIHTFISFHLERVSYLKILYNFLNYRDVLFIKYKKTVFDIMRHLNCRRVIYFIRNIFTVSQVQNINFVTKFTLRVVHTFEVAGELRGASKTADSRIIPSYLERARRHSLIRDIFFSFCLIRA